jgi:hypothetical protein
MVSNSHRNLILKVFKTGILILFSISVNAQMSLETDTIKISEVIISS